MTNLSEEKQLLTFFSCIVHHMCAWPKLDWPLAGVFSEVYTGKGFTVEVHRYAHRSLSRLLVTEVVLNRTTSTLPISLSFDIGAGDQSEDIDFVEEKPG